MNRIPAFVIPLAFSALATLSSSAYAASDIFLKVEGIPGESQDKSHKDEIDVLAWSWQLSQSKDPTNPIVRPLSISKYIDLASAPLYDLLLSGKLAKGDAVLTVRKAGVNNPYDYIVITMSNVTVSAVSTGGNGNEDRLTENISLNFSSACMKYTKTNPDGSPGTITEKCWTYGN